MKENKKDRHFTWRNLEINLDVGGQRQSLLYERMFTSATPPLSVEQLQELDDLLRQLPLSGSRTNALEGLAQELDDLLLKLGHMTEEEHAQRRAQHQKQ